MKNRKFVIFLSVSVALLFATLPLFAEQVPWNGILIDSSEIPQQTTPVNMQVIDGQNPIQPAYGTLDYITLELGPCDAFYRRGLDDYFAPNCQYIQPDAPSTSTDIGFPIHLPAGALIEYIDLWYYDNDATYNPSVGLYVNSGYNTPISLEPLSPGAFSGGNNSVRFGPFAHTVENFVSGPGPNTYYILAILTNGASTENMIYKFTIWYKLQISPAPSTASFSDVPTSHPFFKYVEALVDSGITAGCGGGNYCPDAPLTRGQMAVFLSKALGLHWPY